MRRLIATVLLTTFVMLPLPAWAKDAASASAETKPACGICATAVDDTTGYWKHSGSTLVKGLGNVVLGWSEILIEPVRTTQAKGNVGVGFLRGVGYAVRRTGFGIVEAVTFWMPRCHGKYLQLNKDCPVCAPKP